MAQRIFQSSEEQAAALDTESNVAARVLAIYPRYRRLDDEVKFADLYGIESLAKAKAVAAILERVAPVEAAARVPDTPQARQTLAALLKDDAALCGKLAAIIQAPAGFAQVLTEDPPATARARVLRAGMPPRAGGDEAPRQRAIESGLVGVAVSGGGIRSATFSLGILQALSARGLLTSVDYLSTVSGGGYVGAWLESLLQKESEDKGVNALPDVQRLLSAENANSAQGPEANPIRFLRDYSNYLTPKIGMFSADTWAMAMIWMRNTILNMIVIVSTACLVLLLPRLLGIVFAQQDDGFMIVGRDIAFGFTTNWLSVMTLAVLAIPAILIGRNLGRFSEGAIKGRKWYERQAYVLLGIILPTLVAAFLTAMCMWYFALDSHYLAIGEKQTADTYPWIAHELWVPPIFFLILMFVAEMEGRFMGCFLREGRGLWRICLAVIAFVGYPFISAFVFWICLDLIGRLMWGWPELDGAYHAMTFGTPLIMIAFALAVTIQIGLMGRQFPDDRREWFGKMGAWITIVSLGTLAFFGFSYYAPLLVAQAIAWGNSYAQVGLPVAWIASTISGVLAARKWGEGSGKMSKLVITVAPYVFVVGLVASLACVMHLLTYAGVAWPDFEWDAGFLAERHWDIVSQVPLSWLLWSAVITGGIALLFSVTVDINEFSMHHFYKNRLVRCYLGACRNAERDPNPLTGFDAGDERRLASLRHDGTLERRSDDGTVTRKPAPYAGPYPIVNATLNLVKGDRLSWQERKGTSFTFTPKYCGWQYATTAASTTEVPEPSYRTTNVYAYPVTGSDDGGIGLGTAIAISGAAASPNMGYQSSPALAFLMTVFNVRLGWWLGNPRRDRFKNAGPRYGLNYLVTELFGLTNDHRRYVYLSDGGHFENMGLYELIRRRCQLVMVCDGEQDGNMHFGGLGNAVRKCRTDFGVEIDIDVSRIRKDAAAGISAQHCAVGTIYYPETVGGRKLTGTLVYVKSSLTGDEPTDILEYRARQGEFPHQSTADQFFDESQFESYRRLGYHIADEELHVSTLALHYLEGVGKSSGLKREKLHKYRSELRRAVEKAIQSGFSTSDVIPRLPDLLGHPAAKRGSQQPNGDPAPEDERKQRSLQMMIEVIAGLTKDEGLSRDNPEHRALITLFEHWTRLSGFWAYCRNAPGVSDESRTLLETLLGV
jgi:hypothetical protein